MRLAKKWPVRFCKRLRFSVWFYKINCSFGFFGSVQFCRRHLSFTPLRCRRNDVLPWWIGPTSCQPKWLRTRSAEIRHEDKEDSWSYHVRRWIVNETTWKNVHKPPKSVFWKPNCGNWFLILNFEVSSVFRRKPISDIFIGFHTALFFYNFLTAIYSVIANTRTVETTSRLV